MKNKSHQHRNYLILITGIFLLLSAFVYKYKISSTLALRSEYEEAEQKAGQAINSSEQLLSLKQLAGESTGRQRQIHATKEQLQQMLLNELTELSSSSNTKVTAISDASVIRYDQYTVTGFSAGISGDFNQLLRTLKSFEQNELGMRLASVKFETRMNRETKRKELNAFIYVQHIETI